MEHRVHGEGQKRQRNLSGIQPDQADYFNATVSLFVQPNLDLAVGATLT